MSAAGVNSNDALIAKDFLGWNPPLDLPHAVEICDSMNFSNGHFRDQELDKLTKFWFACGTMRTLPNFKFETKAIFRLLRAFHLKNLFVEIEGLATDYIVTVYSNSSLEKIVSSGRASTRTEAVYNATIDFIYSILDIIFAHLSRR